MVHLDGVTTTSSRAGTDLGQLSDVESNKSSSILGFCKISCTLKAHYLGYS